MTVKSKTDTQLINEQIKAYKVRVISNDGENLGVMLRDAALNLAQEQGLDLVVLTDGEEVPLVKIMDFGKNLYMKKKKMAEGKKKQKVIKVKEIKMKPKIGIHDYQTKMTQAIGFLEDGHKLKITLTFNGREIENMRSIGSAFFAQVDQTFIDQNVQDVLSDKDATISKSQKSMVWSKIYHTKTKNK